MPTSQISVQPTKQYTNGRFIRRYALLRKPHFVISAGGKG